MNFGMGFNMGQRMEVGQRQVLRMVRRPQLTMQQQLELKQVLELVQKLRDPEIPHPGKGIEGLVDAHEILVEKRMPGLLIGGLAEEVYNPSTVKQDYEIKHKDVDVMVIPHKVDGIIIPAGSYRGEFRKFEGGIDWWHPSGKEISYFQGAAKVDEKVTRWTNGHRVALMFGLNALEGAFPRNPLKPGLYIPSVDFIVDMRLAELDTASGKVAVSEKARENYEKMLRWKMRLVTPKVVETGAEDQNPYRIFSFSPEAYAKLVDPLNLDFSVKRVAKRLEKKLEYSTP